MSFYEKYVNSKFYHFSDGLLKVIFVNLLMIATTLLGLVVVGLPVAIVTGVLTLKLVLNKGAIGTFNVYLTILKKILKKSLKTILIYEIILIVLLFNIFYFYSGLEPFSWYYFFCFMIMLLLFGATLIAFMHGLMISSLYDVNIKSLLKHSYLLTIGFSFRGLIWLVAMFMFIYVIILIPILGLFFGLSGISLINYLVLVKGYSKVESLNESLDELLDEIY